MTTWCLFIDKMDNAERFSSRGSYVAQGSFKSATDPFGTADGALGWTATTNARKVLASPPVAAVSGTHWMVWSFWWRPMANGNPQADLYVAGGGDSSASLSTLNSDAFLHYSAASGFGVRQDASVTSPVNVKVQDGQWAHVEYAHRFGSATTGNWLLHINGTQVGSGVGNNTGEPWLYLWLHSVAGTSFDAAGQWAEYSDVVLLWSDDPQPPRTGMLRVKALKPTGTAQGQWTGSDGNSTDNHLLVASGSKNSATWVTATAGSGATDLYTHAPLQAGAVPFAVQVLAAAGMDAAGTDDFGIVVNSGGTLAETKRTLGAGAPAWLEGGGLLTDPKTGAAWTKAGVDAMTFGVSS